jgi:hypothetical protein
MLATVVVLYNRRGWLVPPLYGRRAEEVLRKRLAVLVAAVMMLASAVFAPVALAQEPGEVDVHEVKLGPGGSVTVTGTIECIEGYIYDSTVMVRQRTSRYVYNTVDVFASGTCETIGTGEQEFTATGFSDRPFHRGTATIQALGTLYDPATSNNINWQGEVEAVRIR